jgi:hypothetical protein
MRGYLRFAFASAFAFALSVSGCVGLGEERTLDERAQSLYASAFDRLSIEVGSGELVVIGDPALESIEVEVALRTRLLVPKYDDDAIEALEVVLEPSPEGAALRVSIGELEDRYYADVRVRVPARLVLEIDDGAGDAWVSGVSALEMQDDSGELDVSSIAGAVSVTDDSGNISIEDVGPVTIRDLSGDIVVTGARGDVSVEDDSGELTVLDVRGDVRIVDDSGTIRIDRVDGTVTIDDGSGDIEVGEVGALDVRTDESGELREI